MQRYYCHDCRLDVDVTPDEDEHDEYVCDECGSVILCDGCGAEWTDDHECGS
jgi:DNA-directed RNA polymerase subunit RPC12/RpoP